MNLSSARSHHGDEFSGGAIWAGGQRQPYVGSIMSSGSVIMLARQAIELTRPGTLEPDAATTAAVSRACHQAGLVTLTCGTFGNVIRFLPPLVIGEDLIDEGLSILEDAFAAV